MLTGKRATRWARMLAAILLVACSPKGKQEETQTAPTAAWWYTIEYEPRTTTVHGVDVGTFDKDWKYAASLDANQLKGRISEDDIKKFNQSTLSFSLMTDLDNDGVPENFFVGVYESIGGEKGRFVAITRNGQVLQRFKESGTSGFSALLQIDGEVRWYKCMECGEFESLRWSGHSFILE